MEEAAQAALRLANMMESADCLNYFAPDVIHQHANAACEALERHGGSTELATVCAIVRNAELPPTCTRELQAALEQRALMIRYLAIRRAWAAASDDAESPLALHGLLSQSNLSTNDAVELDYCLIDHTSDPRDVRDCLVRRRKRFRYSDRSPDAIEAAVLAVRTTTDWIGDHGCSGFPPCPSEQALRTDLDVIDETFDRLLSFLNAHIAEGEEPTPAAEPGTEEPIAEKPPAETGRSVPPAKVDIKVDVEQMTLTLDNVTHDVASEQALRWVQVLLNHAGRWISCPKLAKLDSELDGARSDRMKDRLPDEVVQLIQTGRLGSRLVLTRSDTI